MKDQTGKTEGDALEELRQQAKAALEGNPLPPPEAPESEEETEKPSVDAEQAAEPAGQPEEAKAEPTPAPEKDEQIPEKYRDKTPQELIKMLEDQHSYIGKLGSERSFKQSEAEKLREELNVIKSELDAKKEASQAEAFKESLEADPAKAVIDYIDQKMGSVESKVKQSELDRQAKEAYEYYNTLLADQDFAQRKEQVDKVAEALSQYVKPEYTKSKDFVEISNLISKGLNVDAYIQNAKAEVQAAKQADLQEKRESQTVSGSSSGQTASSDPADQSLEELKQKAMAAFAKMGR